MKTRILIALSLSTVVLLGILAWSHVHVSSPVASPPSTISADSKASADEGLGAISADATPEGLRTSALVQPARTGVHQVARASESAAAPRKSRRLSGIVTCQPLGTSVPGASVRAKSTSHGGTMTSTTDLLGQYEIDATTSASMVLCNAPGYVEWQGSIDPGTADVVLDIVLVPKPLKMDVLVRLMGADGKPLLAALDPADRKRFATLRPVFAAGNIARGSCATGLNLFATQAHAVDGNKGEWFLATLPAGASGTCCLVLGDRVLDAAAFGGTANDITLVASLDDLQGTEGSVRLVVVDELTGRPFGGAHVRVTCDGALDKRAITGPDGLAVVERVLEGDARIVVTSFDPERPGETTTEPIVADRLSGETRTVCLVHGGQQTDLGRVMLRRTVTITGRVELKPGTVNLPKVSLSMQSDDASAADPLRVTWPNRLGRVNKDGAFRFSGLEPGWYFVSIDPRYQDSVDLRIPAVPPKKVTVDVDARFGDADQVRIEAPAGLTYSDDDGPRTLDDW